MQIKTREFVLPSDKNADYSHVEVDCFTTNQYRLSIRKNLKTGRYEAYKYFHRTHEKRVIMTYRNLNELLPHTNQLCKEVTGFDPEDYAV